MTATPRGAIFAMYTHVTFSIDTDYMSVTNEVFQGQWRSKLISHWR